MFSVHGLKQLRCFYKLKGSEPFSLKYKYYPGLYSHTEKNRVREHLRTLRTHQAFHPNIPSGFVGHFFANAQVACAVAPVPIIANINNILYDRIIMNAVPRKFAIILTLFCAMLLPGCMTAIDALGGVNEVEGKHVPGPRIYGGFRMTLYRIEHDLIPLNPGADWWYYIVEVPVSLCMDTIILPASLVNELLIYDDNNN